MKKLRSKTLVREIVDCIDSLMENPRPEGVKKLKGSKKQVYYRVRFKEYRIIYEILDGELIVLVVRVGHRREIYKEFS